MLFFMNKRESYRNLHQCPDAQKFVQEQCNPPGWPENAGSI